MFSDSPLTVVGFNHTETHRMKYIKKEIACQYTGLFTENKLCDTINTKTVATQTNEIQNIDIGHVDLVALNNCLEKGFNLLKTECNGWPKMNYFETTEKNRNNDININVSLSHQPLFGTNKVSALCWNCTGNNLIIATGEYIHTQWCNHLNFVFIYTMSDLEKGLNNVCNKLEVISCVTCLATHPTNEHLITAGLYNGELLICNINDNMNMVSLEWHSQSVSELLWFIRSDHRVILITAGRDGYICIGTMVSDKIKFTQRLCRYLVGVPGKIGIRCFDYTERHFLVALENGKISSYLSEMTKNIKEDQILQPVKVETYTGCSIIIENLKFCNINSIKFLITQFDCTILVYNIYQKEPQKIIFNTTQITNLCWSLNNEYIVYGLRECGELEKIDLINGKTVSIKKITLCNLTLMNINPIRKNIIAIGTIYGEICITKYE